MMRTLGFAMGCVLALAACAGGNKAPEPVRVTDLLRTYVQGDVPAGVVLEMPQGYASGLETIAQARFADAMEAAGYQILIANDDASDAANNDPSQEEPLRVVFTMDAPAGVLDGPWRSPIQLQEPINPQLRLPTGPLLTTSDFSGPPLVAFNPGTKGAAIIPPLKMRITIKQGQRDLWTGVAHSALDGRSRQGLAFAMADALAGSVNQSIDLRDFRFTPATTAVQEIVE